MWLVYPFPLHCIIPLSRSDRLKMCGHLKFYKLIVSHEYLQNVKFEDIAIDSKPKFLLDLLLQIKKMIFKTS